MTSPTTLPVNVDSDFLKALPPGAERPPRSQFPVRTVPRCFVTNSGIALKRLKS